MAEVFRHSGRRKLEYVVAVAKETQAALDRAATERGIEAEALLNARADERTGGAQIEIDQGDVDRYVVLDDENGEGAALSIEYGRGAGEKTLPNGRVIRWGEAEPLRILRDTFPELNK